MTQTDTAVAGTARPASQRLSTSADDALERYIAATVAAAPPLTAEQSDHLSVLLHGHRSSPGLAA